MRAPALTIIGLDAATLDVVEPLVGAGELPNIGRILEGAAGVLRSTTHPITPNAWVTLATGVNAGRHGVWDFLERDETGYGLVPINGSYRRAPALWDILAGSNVNVGLVAVPFTWPAPEVESFAVSGFDAPGGWERNVHPSSLAPELEAKYADVRLDDTTPVNDQGEFDLDLVRRGCEAKTALTLRLATDFEPRLLFVVFMAADYVHHACWPEWEERGPDSRVAEVYRMLDRAVGELSRDGNVMLVSDHGAGPLRGVVSLNGWLAREGFLAYRPRHGRVRRKTREMTRRLSGREDDRTVIDWRRTQAFAYGMFGNVVINVRGRERHGIVDPADYEGVRDEIGARALALRAEDGERIVAAVHRREDLCEGPHLDRIPDLIVEFDEYAWLGTGSPDTRSEEVWDSVSMRIGARGGWAASHRHEGLLALAGPSAARGVRLSASILDIASTALYLLGEPIPAGLEGRVVTEAIDPSLLGVRPLMFSGDAPPSAGAEQEYEDTSKVEKRLRDLGYLE